MYIALGSDCSPAAALRNLNLRDCAMPFDWVQCSVPSILSCLHDNFAMFHQNLKFNSTKTRVIDSYGLEFPHDYPFVDNEYNEEDVGEGVIGEDQTKQIISDYAKYTETVLEKYRRRINRFQEIMSNDEKVIIFSRHSHHNVMNLYIELKKLYNKDFYIINSNYDESRIHSNIVNCYTEKNGVWNDQTVWKNSLLKLSDKI
jgi:hypothetical protein